MFKRQLVSKVLIIAPLRVCHLVWPKEQQKWMDFAELRVVVLHGAKKDELLKQDADIYVINPEGLDWLLDTHKTKTPKGKTKVEVDLRRWRLLGFDTLIIDELSKFKHVSTNRFKALKLVLHTFGRRWGLTGSPAANGLLDLFGQCYILDQGRSLGPFITHYRSKYFETVDKEGFVWVPKPGAEEAIYERVAPLALRMAAEDYLELPELVQNVVKLDLPPDVRKVYDQLEEDLITRLDEGVVVAQNAAAASVKCRQVANGGIYLTPDLEITGFKLPKVKREWVNLHTVKVDALADLIDELQGSPLLVAYDFEHDLDRLRVKLGTDLPYIGGGVSTTRSKELERLWNAGKLPVLAAHPQAIAHGLNLQELGNHVCWHSMTFDYELYDQFIRRVLRQGNKAKRVFVHHLLMRNTVDEVMLLAVKRKAKGQNALFEALQLLARHRKKGVYIDQ
jgi:SNF2 family DNA or RNA helicase